MIQCSCFLCDMCLIRSAMVTAICAYIQSTCSKRGYNILVAIVCRQITFLCHLVQFPTVLTTLTPTQNCLTVAPVSAWRKSRQRCSEKWKYSTFVPTAERFTGRVAITRKCMRSSRIFCQRTATSDRDVSQVV